MEKNKPKIIRITKEELKTYNGITIIYSEDGLSVYDRELTKKEEQRIINVVFNHIK